MIILKANRELEMTFSRLIKTMGVPVEWTKYFVVIGDYLIIQGRVRSLFFNFENKKVVTNVVDIPFEGQEIVEIADDSKVCNVLNLVLYAFGKWGVIKGIKVEKDYVQVNQLFESVLREFHVDPNYSQDSFRFFKEGIRINYEDVVQFSLEATEEKIEEEEDGEEKSQGLWYKLVWKKKVDSFIKTETTFEERQSKRLGKNFYMVGYQCPKCKENLHMVVFPQGDEFRIETEEGRVLLARTYTCESCHCFYTPRPRRLLVEGDIYVMEFSNDARAYEDYLDLLGERGDRVSNYNFNEFESLANKSVTDDGKETIEELCDNIESLSREELFRLENMMEEGFYPGESVKRLEDVVDWESRKRKGNLSPQEEAYGKGGRKKTEKNGSKLPEESIQDKAAEDSQDASWQETPEEEEVVDEKIGHAARLASQMLESDMEKEKTQAPKVSPVEQAAAKRRYEAKFGVLDRLSVPQIKELRSQLEKENKLPPEDKAAYLLRLDAKEEEKRLSHVRQRAAEGAKSSNYGQISKVIQEIEEENLPRELKEELLVPLYARQQQQAEAEVAKLMSSMPKSLDRAGYEKFKKKLAAYPQVDVSAYEEQLEEARGQAEANEIAVMVKRARTGNRQDLSDLANRLQNHGFKEELLTPYLEKINKRIRQMDEEAIDEICGNLMQMNEEEAMDAYQRIQEGAFLPELKTHALEMLNKRIVKIKTDECELLVNKLQDAMTESMKNNMRHHFYPARKVMMREATSQEMKEIRFALDTYGTSCGTFEYPILVVDTSRNESGKEGMILTPEHLFYHTMMNAYDIAIGDIRSIKTSTGLLNSGITIELKNGTKAKIPYAVEKQELKAWGNILRDFIKYLQERPDSRKVAYLAKEKHETICCFRCGFTYKGGNICPKCGYKMNQ